MMGEVGRTIVGLSTIAFVGLTMLGLWLWWPTTRTVRRAFLIRPRVGLKRLNYDAHNVLGFYAAFVLFILGATGLMFSYPGLQTFGARVANSLVPARSAPGAAPSAVAGDSSVPMSVDSTRPADRAWAIARDQFPDAAWQRLTYGPGDPPVIRVAVGAGGASHPGRFHTVRFDPRGELRGVVRFGQERAAVRLSRLVGELHTGSLNGAYRVAAFLACVVGAVLPITGTLIWFPRWRRRRRQVTDGRAAFQEGAEEP